jgi:hypothetical protein
MIIKDQNRLPYTNFQTKQHDIISLLLKFRHLNQTQIQMLLHHKAKERIRTTLNVLTEEGYIVRSFDREMAGKPARYCIAKKGIAYLYDLNLEPKLLRRLYNDPTLDEGFKEHCMFIATVYLSLQEIIGRTDATFQFKSNTDMYNIRYLILPHPDAYIYITYPSGEMKQYFLDVFDNRTFIYKRVHLYLRYYKKNYWQYKTKSSFPEIIFICPDDATQKSIYSFIQKEASLDAPIFFLTTKKKVLAFGMCPEVLTKVEI